MALLLLPRSSALVLPLPYYYHAHLLLLLLLLFSLLSPSAAAQSLIFEFPDQENVPYLEVGPSLSRGEARFAVTRHCREHRVGSFDCATVLRLLQSMENWKTRERVEGLEPTPVGPAACSPATRTKQRLAFLESFPAHGRVGASHVDPGYFNDENAFTWPFSGGHEHGPWEGLMKDIVRVREGRN